MEVVRGIDKYNEGTECSRQAGRQTFFAPSMLCYISFICNEMIMTAVIVVLWCHGFAL